MLRAFVPRRRCRDWSAPFATAGTIRPMAQPNSLARPAGITLAAQTGAKPVYAMFRFIGLEDGRREIVRVDRYGPNGTVRIVPETRTANRSAIARYFQETIKLAPDEIYVSPVDLTAEQRHPRGSRTCRPFGRDAGLSADGKPFGIVIINADMRPRFDRVRSSPSTGRDHIRGRRQGRLSRPSRSFARIRLVARQAERLASDFPRLASHVGATQSVAHTAPDQDARPDGIALAPALLAGSEWVAVIEAAPQRRHHGAGRRAIRNTSLLVGSIAVLCAAALAFLVARSLTRPIVRLTEAVEGVARKGTAIIPVDAGGETGVLARAFARVMDEVNAKTVALEREVIEHLRTEAARKHHAGRERLFSAAVESSNDAIITQSLDGLITGWNPAAERLFGYTAAEAVGRHISLIVPADRLGEVDDIVAPDQLGRNHRAERNRAAAQGRNLGRGRAQHIADQGGFRRDHRHLQDRPRHHRVEPHPTRVAAADRGATAHLRNLAGFDPGHQRHGHSGPGQSQFRRHPGILAGGDARSQRARLHLCRGYRACQPGSTRRRRRDDRPETISRAACTRTDGS